MKVDLKEISIGELTEDYEDNEEAGVKGYSTKLDIRPPYQRGFTNAGNSGSRANG